MKSELNNGSWLSGSIENLPITDLRPPLNNLRLSNNLNIEKIANSVQQHGLLHAIVVRPKDDHFEIVAGYRRFLACKSLKWKKVPCHIVHLDDAQSFEVTLTENIRRKSFTPLEEATAFKIYVADHGWGSIRELSKKIGRSPSSIVRRIGLLSLPEDVLEKIRNYDINPSTAQELLSLEDPERQSHLARLVARRHVTIKKLRNMIKDQSILDNDSVNEEVYDTERRSRIQSIDKSIITLRIAMNRIISIIEEEEEKTNDFLIRETLLSLKNNLHDQIDTLMNSKRKLAKHNFGTARF
ncbi:MAG: ParB/RepB/Spo0J family partition protein [Candidatus Nitrosocosmicus sp.]|nr:ParB/RepB/Spo0J family partition protein [Candidatus Nitrosocosmicus sp.]